jgi:hypothetical protein
MPVVYRRPAASRAAYLSSEQSFFFVFLLEPKTNLWHSRIPVMALLRGVFSV